jgi:hypothetical protein
MGIRGHSQAKPWPQTGDYRMIKIVYNRILGGWYVVRGAHQTPLSGWFETKVLAQAYLHRHKAKP